MKHILALDQGTSSSRSIVFDAHGRIVALAQRELTQHYPHPGWVEHDPMEIWQTQLATAREAIAQAGLTATEIRAIGITNQRETTLLWNRQSGQPLHRAIVWQDRRTEPLCAALREQGPASPGAAAHRAAHRPVLLGHQAALAARPRARRAPTPPRAASWPSARSTAGCCGS
jgi:glycerol kinase